MDSRPLYYLSEAPPPKRFELFANLPDIVGISAASNALGISEANMRRIVKDGKLRSFRAGTRVLITKTALIEFTGEAKV